MKLGEFLAYFQAIAWQAQETDEITQLYDLKREQSTKPDKKLQ